MGAWLRIDMPFPSMPWRRRFLGFTGHYGSVLFCWNHHDNQSAIALSTDHQYHIHTRHIDATMSVSNLSATALLLLLLLVCLTPVSRQWPSNRGPEIICRRFPRNVPTARPLNAGWRPFQRCRSRSVKRVRHVNGDAQSPVTPRPRYVTSHSQNGHKCWDIVISQQLHRFSPFIL